MSNSLFSDSKLAVYQVDKVLLPLEIFGAPAPAPGPAPPESKKKKKANGVADEPTASPKEAADNSSGCRLWWIERAEWVVFVVVGSFFWLNL